MKALLYILGFTCGVVLAFRRLLAPNIIAFILPYFANTSKWRIQVLALASSCSSYSVKKQNLVTELAKASEAMSVTVSMDNIARINEINAGLEEVRSELEVTSLPLNIDMSVLLTWTDQRLLRK